MIVQPNNNFNNKIESPTKKQLLDSKTFCNVLGFSTMRGAFSVGSMTYQSLRVRNLDFELKILKNVFKKTFPHQVGLNMLMASMSLGIYEMGVDNVSNKELYKMVSITIGQLCLMQPIYNNVITAVHDQISPDSKPIKRVLSYKVIPFIAVREMVSIGFGFLCADRLKHNLKKENGVSEYTASLVSGLAVGMISATITQPIHNTITYHVGRQQEGCSQTIQQHGKRLYDKYKTGIISRGLIARYCMVIPTIVCMNTFLSPIYDSYTKRV